MTPQGWQSFAAVVGAFAALLGGLYAVVTRPIQAQFVGIQTQLTDIIHRLERIEAKLDDHEKRITTLEAQRWR